MGSLIGQYSGEMPEYFFDKPKLAHKKPFDPNGDPVFLTSTGSSFGSRPEIDYPKHWKAAVNIKSLVPWEWGFNVSYSRPTLSISGNFAHTALLKSNEWPIFHIRPLKRIKEIDSDGNSVLNRILMSHIVLDQPTLNLAVLQLKRRKMVSLKPNRFGQTPLMLAVESGWPSLVDEVLSFKPNLMARDKEGHDIIDYLANSPTRVDERYIAIRTIWTRETICQSLLDYATPRELSLIKPRAVALLKTIRVSNEQGIFP